MPPDKLKQNATLSTAQPASNEQGPDGLDKEKDLRASVGFQGMIVPSFKFRTRENRTTDLIMKELCDHLSFAPGVEVTNIIHLLGEMQAALLRNPNPQFETFINFVDRKKRELYLYRRTLSRAIVVRSIVLLLPKELEVKIKNIIRTLFWFVPKNKYLKNYI